MTRKRIKKKLDGSSVKIGDVSGGINRSIIAGRDIVINLPWMWKLIAVALLFAGIGYAVSAYGPNLYHWYKYKANDDEILILLANFKDESENVTYDATGSIAEALQAALTKYDLPDVRLVLINQTFERSEIEAVKILGKQYNATIFIWGHYDDGGMFPRFTILQEERLGKIPEGPRDFLVNLASPPDDFTLYINRSLPSQMIYFTDFTVGQIYYLKQSFSEALILFEDAIRSIGNNNIDAVRGTLADIYFMRGFIYGVIKQDDHAAILNYTRAIELNPDFSEAYSNRGFNYVNTRNPNQAIQDCTQAIELDPSDFNAYNNRGLAYLISNDFENAIHDFTKAIEIKQNFVEAYINRGIAYFKSENLEQAILDYTQAIQLNQNFVDAYFNRGIAYKESGNLDHAISDFSQVIELNPDDSRTYYYRGNVQLDSGNLEQAIQDYTKAIELNPQFGEAFVNRGNAYYKSGAAAPAIHDYSKAIELEVDYLGVYNNRGLAYIASGQPELAILDFNYVVKLNPTFAATYNNRGNAYRAIGSFEKAILDYEHYLELDPNAPNQEEIIMLINELRVKLKD